jgi:hypothetical protein
MSLKKFKEMRGRLVDHEEVPGIGIVGRLKIGEKVVSANGREHPKSLDYFKPDAPKQYQDLFHEAFGEKPQKIEIIFISDDVTHSCNLQYELRGDKGGLFAKGDGESFEIFHTDHWVPWGKERLCEKYGSIENFKAEAVKHCLSFAGWETRLTLRFLIPKIKGLLAEWQLSTKATKSSIGQITGAFDKVQLFAGTIINIPFDLSVEMSVQDGHQSKRKYPVLKLIPNASFENLQILKTYVQAGIQPWKAGVLTDSKILELQAAKK